MKWAVIELDKAKLQPKNYILYIYFFILKSPLNYCDWEARAIFGKKKNGGDRNTGTCVNVVLVVCIGKKHFNVTDTIRNQRYFKRVLFKNI